MARFFDDLLASFTIFVSNFTAKFGLAFNVLLILAVLALLGVAVVRAIAAGATVRRSSPLRHWSPDEALAQRAAENLAKAVRIPTVTGDEAAMQRLRELLRTEYADVLAHTGFAVLPGGSVLLRWKAEKRSELLPVLLCAHMDVVPAGEGWEDDPFSGAVQDGYIHGRGTTDCKHVLIALLEAVRSLMQEGFAPQRDIYFAFGHDEETGGAAGAQQIAALLEKQGLRFEMILDEGGSITDAHLGRKNYPAALIATGEKASCNFRITATTRGGHSSQPPRHTTLGVLSEALCRIETSQPHHNILPIVRDYLRLSAPAMTFGKRFAVCNMPWSGPLLTTVFRRDPAVLALLRSTVVPTQIGGAPAPNILPHQASAVVNARLLPVDSPADMLRYLRGLLSDLPVTVEPMLTSEAVQPASVKHPMYQLLQSTLQQRYPKMPCIPTLMPGGTDSRHYGNLSDCVLRFTPFVLSAEENSLAHGPNEKLSVHSLGMAVELYKDLMRKL